MKPQFIIQVNPNLGETFVPNLVSLTCSSLQIGQNLDGGMSNFQISGQSLIKENCHNPRSSDDIYIMLASAKLRRPWY